jgi:hypothetical protein
VGYIIEQDMGPVGLGRVRGGGTMALE